MSNLKLKYITVNQSTADHVDSCYGCGIDFKYGNQEIVEIVDKTENYSILLHPTCAERLGNMIFEVSNRLSKDDDPK